MQKGFSQLKADTLPVLHGVQHEDNHSPMQNFVCAQVLARVFITPMPVLRLLERLGVSRELKLLQEAVATMRDSLLGVIHVRL